VSARDTVQHPSIGRPGVLRHVRRASWHWFLLLGKVRYMHARVASVSTSKQAPILAAQLQHGLAKLETWGTTAYCAHGHAFCPGDWAPGHSLRPLSQLSSLGSNQGSTATACCLLRSPKTHG
jgi:hypothetical protein